MGFVFEWDEKKAVLNIRKHKVRFDEAITVFDDPLAYILNDEEHSETETREIIIGRSIASRLLIVSFTQRAEDRIRIISARQATSIERKDYEENTNN